LSSTTNYKRSEFPIACTLSGSDWTRRQGTVAKILGQAQRVEELADGYAFGFPGSAEWGHRLVDFINSERVCCRFFTFELVFEPNFGQIWLRVKGPEGVKEFVKDELASLTSDGEARGRASIE
jgi:hypothetical protein